MDVTDVVVDEEVARRLVRDQALDVLPHLGSADLELVGMGWDNLIVRLGEDHLARLPVRAESAELAAKEIQWLPRLAGSLPVASPVPVFVGSPTDYYPWPWQICRWIPGILVAEIDLAGRGPLVDGLASTLSSLHRPAPPDAPANPFRGVPLVERADAIAHRIDQWSGPRDSLRTAWRVALRARPWPGPRLWLHGDPHPRNLVADDDGTLVGLLDFGDLTAGDPANDLATAWWTFDAADRARFIRAVDERAELDDDVWIRAAGWAAALASAIVEGSAMYDVALHTAAQLEIG